MESTTENLYEIRIHSDKKWSWIDFRSIFEFRDLVYLLVRRDFVVRYAQTILGPIWFFLQPLFTTIVFTIIFNRVSRLPTDGLPPMLFYLTGITIWTFFSQNIIATSDTFVLYASIFEKVYFPRIITPLAATCSNLFTLGVQLLSLIGFIIFFRLQGANFTPRVAEAFILVPLLILQAAVLSLGVGLFLSSLTARYRDVCHLITFMMQTWLYATPIVYPASKIPDSYRWLMIANPAAPILENFRGVFLGASSVTFFETTVSVALTIIILLVGQFSFQRTAQNFVDSV
jgi:lipopolysaccharide transport system permease protein